MESGTEESAKVIAEKPVEPIQQMSFEGIPVTGTEGMISSMTLDMEAGYPIGTHLRLEVEVRVANVRYEEGKGRRKGDFIRRHVFATEAVTLTSAFLPSEESSAPTGNLGGSEGLVEPELDAEAYEGYAEAYGAPALAAAEEPTDVLTEMAEAIYAAESSSTDDHPF